MAHNRDYKPEDILFPEQHIVENELVKEMQSSYIDYAMSVIVGRALPDARDGLKPVHRRILYAMYEDGLTRDKPFRKCATAVGDVLGRYHPHGDASVYDALVRLAQDFSMRYPLIDGHGNFGSVDGDPPAAYRYTEARMAKMADEMLRDIEKETVDWDPNFDETRKEPRVLPSRFPNLLVNGSSGIAVGMATNIPPHNLTEVINAAVCVLDNPDARLEDLMQHMQGPDFPTKGIIMGRSGIRQAYATGRGRVVVRARTEFEEYGRDRRTRIIVTELPYQVNKRALVLNNLLKQTQLQTTFSIIMLALVENQTQPRILSLRHMLDEYLDFQKDVVARRTQYELRKARERAHLLEGLLIAQDNIDEVIRIIRSRYDDAKEALMERFGLDDVQAQAICDMRLISLQGLNREKLQNEYDELQEKIAWYVELLSDPVKLNNLLKEELIAIRDKYGDKRKTEIQDVFDEIDVEDLIPEENCVYTMTHNGYIKRLPASEYHSQNRGGKGVKAMTTRDEDFVETVFTASSHDYILFFTSNGKVYKKKGYQIPEASRTSRGVPIVNFVALDPGEKVQSMLHVRAIEGEQYVFFTTRNGTVKRIPLEDLKNIRTSGIRALTLDEGDELISVFLTDGDQNILIATARGMSICFHESDVRSMGRNAVGVRGIKLREGDRVIGAGCTVEGSMVLSVTEKGYGKRTPAAEYLRGEEAQKRGGYGMKNYNITEKTGNVVQMKIISGDEDLLLVSDDGVIIRTDAGAVPVYGRAAQGVRLMRVGEGSHVISIACTEKEEEDEAEAEEAEEATVASETYEPAEETAE